MRLADTHTHLYLSQFDDDREAVIKAAIDSGVEKFYLPDIDASHRDALNELAASDPERFYPMVGLHPCSVNESFQQELNLIEEALRNTTQPYVAIGEIGLDLYWDKTTLPLQIQAFERQVELALVHELPIIIHVREAFEEIFEILDRLNTPELTGIFHCFTGNSEQARHILNYGGFKLGIGGVVTFKNAGLDKTVADLSLNDLVLETDSPYLAPAPYRGKRNQSAYITRVAEKLADIFNLPTKEVAAITSRNAHTVFHGKSAE